MHKIYVRLLDQYLNENNHQAIEIVKRTAIWISQKLCPLTEKQRALMLRNQFGGMNDPFYVLYAMTNNPNHKWLAEYFYHDAVLNPLKKNKRIF